MVLFGLTTQIYQSGESNSEDGGSHIVRDNSTIAGEAVWPSAELSGFKSRTYTCYIFFVRASLHGVNDFSVLSVQERPAVVMTEEDSARESLFIGISYTRLSEDMPRGVGRARFVAGHAHARADGT